jgi:hypothetical protein
MTDNDKRSIDDVTNELRRVFAKSGLVFEEDAALRGTITALPPRCGSRSRRRRHG